MSFTITDLKKHLGPGLGLRKNKYLIEIPVPGIEGRTLNILCRSAGLPERQITTQTVWHKGRRFNVRGETDYMGTYEVSILDDSRMNVRQVFDKWLKKVDNSKPKNAGILGSSNESGVGAILDTVKSGLEVANQIKNVIENPAIATDFALGLLDEGNALSAAKYQTDINIWQLSKNNDKVYGYKLQNAFPSSIGIVTLDDEDENGLSEFSIVFTFSEFTPLENKSLIEQFAGAILGDDAKDIYDGVESLFD